MRAIILFISVLFSAGLYGKALEWQQPYAVNSKGESIANILKNFSANYNIQAVISSQLTTRVFGSYSGKNGRDFLDQLARRNAFTWYNDNGAIYFYATSEYQNRVFHLRYITPEYLEDMLRKVGIWDGRFNWQVAANEQIVYISGPPRFINLIEQTIWTLDVDHTQETYVLKIFPLKYASAVNTHRLYRGTSREVKGVAHVLRRLVGMTQTTQDNNLLQNSRQQNSLTPMGEADVGPANQNGALMLAPESGPLASIEGDPRLNAVVIYDKAERMPMYQEAIKTLDVRAEQIEIDVTILNISTEKAKQLGLDWTIGSTGNNVAGTNNSINVDFEADIRILEKSGHAQISSRPVVVTGNHQSTILDNSTTFYVRVAGQEDAELFPVSVGTSIDLTPHLILEDGRHKVIMDINIEDGQRNGDQVDSIPVVSATSISTQAMIDEGGSLVVGGYHYDVEIHQENRVPGLHALPWVGGLFKFHKKSIVNMVRLFIIKPRIID
ncbi:type III secretion system outer membrane ring subunit SctC [Thalassomonas viridans]|uniref:Type 3 secretion system secretin n=1 Tax=Thalassomonas viridans TaxID=137584 RepID=A0AAE9Z9P7_9GAMM|nr:type III secretion system outer membrane ring subunit SctC [Thalassomonas viridans]WDE08615.1 type III secretion system outer membrane ring subunit SctC [Thalassomonas viridans]